MQTIAKECDALIAAYREIDRLRAGVVELKAYIRRMEAEKTMALDYGTVPQNGVQVIDFIGAVHVHHVPSCHSDTVTTLASL